MLDFEKVKRKPLFWEFENPGWIQNELRIEKLVREIESNDDDNTYFNGYTRDNFFRIAKMVIKKARA